MKRFLSLFLALVMAFTLAVPAFADEPGDPNEGIMLLAQIYRDDSVYLPSGSPSAPFTTTANNGRYLRVWFHNDGTEPVKVELRDHDTDKCVQSKLIQPGSNDDTFVYTIPTPSRTCSFYLYFESNGPSGARVVGQAAAAQYTSYPPAA